KYTKTEVVQPHPEKSEYTIPKSPWNMPFSRASAMNADYWDTQRWKTEKLKQELENYNISFEANTTLSELITLLNDYLCSEMINFDR
ncbi:15103_t:CDS:2, partial [Gigaspora rosea]